MVAHHLAVTSTIRFHWNAKHLSPRPPVRQPMCRGGGLCVIRANIIQRSSTHVCSNSRCPVFTLARISACLLQRIRFRRMDNTQRYSQTDAQGRLKEESVARPDGSGEARQYGTDGSRTDTSWDQTTTATQQNGTRMGNCSIHHRARTTRANA